MNNGGFWATLLGEAPTMFIILVLVLLNSIFLYVTWVQKHRCRKLERELLAIQTFGSASPFSAKRRLNKEKARLQTETCQTVVDDVAFLKIDRAIIMLKKGSSLEEIKTALDIEANYLKILATHHTG